MPILFSEICLVTTYHLTTWHISGLVLVVTYMRLLTAWAYGTVLISLIFRSFSLPNYTFNNYNMKPFEEFTYIFFLIQAYFPYFTIKSYYNGQDIGCFAYIFISNFRWRQNFVLDIISMSLSANSMSSTYNDWITKSILIMPHIDTVV